jgi:hypothetical protein
MAGTLRMAVRQDEGGVLPGWCNRVECRDVAARSASGPVVALGRVGHLPDVVGIVVPTPPDWI